jgi:hypothetical protein
MSILLLMSLYGAAPQLAPSATPAKQASNNLDKVICRRFTVTGSLVSSYKTCKTRREWDREHEALRTGPGSNSCGSGGIGAKC